MNPDVPAERWYQQASASWYSQVLVQPQGPEMVEELMVGFTGPTGSWEIGLRWYQLSPSSPPAMRVELYDDAFSAFSGATDLLSALEGAAQSGKSPSVETVRGLLGALGFEDRTEQQVPAVMPLG